MRSDFDEVQQIAAVMDAWNEARIEAEMMLLNIVKEKCRTYKEVEVELSEIRRKLFYENDGMTKYGRFIDEMLELLNKEKSDLPLTNRL